MIGQTKQLAFFRGLPVGARPVGRSVWARIAFAFLLVAQCVPGAQAACSRTTNFGDIPIALPATITVPANAPVGMTLATVTQAIPGAAAGFNFANCSGGNIYWAIRDGPLVAGRVGSTSVPGIGYTTSLSGGGFAGTPTMDMVWAANAAPGGPSSLTFSSQLSATVSLVVTGPVGSGALSVNPAGSSGYAGVYAAFYVGELGDSLFRIVAAGAPTVSQSSCTVNTPKLTVSLPQARSSALQNVGDTTGATTATIGLTCPAGLKVNVTLTDATTPANTSANLTLTPDSSAKGVGLQILNSSGAPVAYGPDSAAAGNLNQWSAGVSTAGGFNVPLTVQYVRTSGPLQPGTVRGLATFTMSYQ